MCQLFNQILYIFSLVSFVLQTGTKYQSSNLNEIDRSEQKSSSGESSKSLDWPQEEHKHNRGMIIITPYLLFYYYNIYSLPPLLTHFYLYTPLYFWYSSAYVLTFMIHRFLLLFSLFMLLLLFFILYYIT